MENAIHLRLEVCDNKGQSITTYWKNIRSDFTPAKDMVFSGEGYTLESSTVYFDLDNGNVHVRFVEYIMGDVEPTAWDFLTEQGWTKK